MLDKMHNIETLGFSERFRSTSLFEISRRLGGSAITRFVTANDAATIATLGLKIFGVEWLVVAILCILHLNCGCAWNT